MKRLFAFVPLIICLGLTLSPLAADAYKYNKPGKRISTDDTLGQWNWLFHMPLGNPKRLKYQVTRVTGPHHPIKEGNTAIRFEARYGDCGWGTGDTLTCGWNTGIRHPTPSRP